MVDFTAKVHQSLSYVYGYGRVDWLADGAWDAGTHQVAPLTRPAVPIAGVPLHHHKVVGGVLVEMTQQEKDAVDAARPAHGLDIRYNVIVSEELTLPVTSTLIGSFLWEPDSVSVQAGLSRAAFVFSHHGSKALDISLRHWDGMNETTLVQEEAPAGGVFALRSTAEVIVPSGLAEYRCYARTVDPIFPDATLNSVVFKTTQQLAS